MSDLSFDNRFGMNHSPKKLVAWVVALLSTVSSIFTVFRVSPVDPHRWLTPPQPLFHLDPRIKGISIPSEDSIKFKNVDSKFNLDHFLIKRASPNAWDREIAEKDIQEIIYDERENPSPRTQGYLLALDGQFYLDSGRREVGVDQLEKAAKQCPQDPLIKALLLRAYEEANRDLELRSTPWPTPLQEQIRGYGLKINGLRKELKPFLQALAVSPRDLYLSSPSLRTAWCASGREGTGPSSACDAGDRYLHVRLSELKTSCAGERACDLMGAAEAYRRALDLLRDLRTTREDEEVDGARSLLSSLWVDRDPVPARRVLAVGIDDYDSGSGFAPLAYARSDAERLAQAFARLGYGADSLVDREATRENILASLARESLSSRPGDDFVLYFSGHGFSDAQGQEGLVTAPETAEPLSLVRLSEVARILSFHKGTTTIIVDGCANNLGVRFGVRKNDGSYGPNRARLILAASPGGVAFESQRLRAGLYTYALVDFLNRENGKSRASAGYHLDFDELFAATSLETARLSRKMYAVEQHPTRLELGVAVNGGKP